jgi:uncharacterized protein (DUF924 family)
MSARGVLDFWFGAPGSAGYGTARTEWFRKDAAFDALIARRFGSLVERALAGGLRDWDAAADSALARIIVLDQFTRNSFRGTARAFAGDALALQAARAMVAARRDATLAPLQRAFAYLPFEHAEDATAQDESVALFTRLAADAPDTRDMLDYAHRHRDVIRRFGRFPHRNEALARPSSADELAFLEQPGSRF